MTAAKITYADVKAGRVEMGVWESATSAQFGGVFSRWPQWALECLRDYYGYVPGGAPGR